jgi:uncharacterized protein involved in exopolysaccharide biosynthesis
LRASTENRERERREGEIDLGEVFAKLWLRRWWVVSGAVPFIVAFGAAAFLMTPIYRATTVLVPATVDRSGMGTLGSTLGQLSGLAALAGINIGPGQSQTEESLAVLRSRELTERFIRDKELMPDLFPRRWNQKLKTWKGPEDDWPTPAEAYEYFDEKIRTISQDKKTGLITMDIEWKDPDEAAQWANELVARLNAEMRARAVGSTSAAVGYLEKELAATSTVDTREAISRLMEAQINQRMFANVTEEYALRVVDRAMPPDPKDVVRPKKLALLALGLVLGLVCGSFVVLVKEA